MAIANGKNSTMNGDIDQFVDVEPGLELFLSRGAYRSGDTVCGTVRLFLRNRHEGVGRAFTTSVEEQSRLGNYFTYASIHVSGKCRVDARWHPAASSSGVLKDLYGSVHPVLRNDLPPETIQAEANSDLDDPTSHAGRKSLENSTVVCFFATNCSSLLDLPQRGEPIVRSPTRKTPTNDEWSDISDHPADTTTNSTIDALQYNTTNSNSLQQYMDISATYAEKCRHLAFTFQVPLPEDLPPTTYATCCRYFYSAVLSVRTCRNQILTVQLPFTLMSCARMRMIHNSTNTTQQMISSSSLMLHTSHMTMDKRSKTRVQVGLCSAKAHCNSLPCHVSASTYTRRTQIGVSSTGLCSTMTIRDTRYLRMTNADGIPACILKAIGSRVMLPGGRLLLLFEFDPDQLVVLANNNNNNNNNNTNTSSALQCLQIGACLRGEEVACHGTIRVVTRTYMLDTGHAYVDQDVDSISMTLGLPLDSPCSLSTELVEISIVCRIELTVCNKHLGGHHHHPYYEVLTMELPIEVVETKIFQEEESYTGVVDSSSSGNNLSFDDYGSADELEETSLDILNDLTMLSIRMLDAVKMESC